MSQQEKPKLKPLSARQAKAMKVIRAGGLLTLNGLGNSRYRALDAARNPVMTVQYRTFAALQSSGRIIRTEEGFWIRKPLKTKKRETKKI